MQTKNLLLLISLFFSYTIAFGQSQSLDSTWKLDFKTNGVSCYFKIIRCNDIDCVLLAFKNDNTNSVIISWQEKITADEIINDTQSQIKTYILQPGSTIQNNCGSPVKSILIVSAADLEPARSTISDFHFANVTVKQPN